MPWGVGWGGSPWGDGSGSGSGPGPTGFYVVAARAVANYVVRVTFSQQPLFKSPLGDTDAANLANWQIVLTEDGSTPIILTVRSVGGDANSLDLIMMTPWKSQLFTYEVRVFNVVSAADAALEAPTTAMFAGLPAAMLAAQEFKGALLDVRNPQASETSVNGSLVIGSSGDYELETGPPLLQKLIIRRLLTKTNEFLHLNGYGFGLDPCALYLPSDLTRLKKQIELQVMLEPEVAACVATPTLSRDNRLTVILKAQLKRTGQSLSFSLPLQSGGAFNLEF